MNFYRQEDHINLSEIVKKLKKDGWFLMIIKISFLIYIESIRELFTNYLNVHQIELETKS